VFFFGLPQRTPPTAIMKTYGIAKRRIHAKPNNYMQSRRRKRNKKERKKIKTRLFPPPASHHGNNTAGSKNDEKLKITKKKVDITLSLIYIF
jgi:hypothetical protein